MRLLVATTNAGKAREFRRLLADFEFEVDDLSAFSSLPVVEETGHTFGANACLKASYYAKGLESWTLADDSGLAVDALNGSPGVHSARWAQMNQAGHGDADNNSLLLRQLELVSDERRTARFVCVLALSDPAGRIVMTASDWVHGRILRAARGEGGFGYDPLFFLDSHGKTTAELPPEEKNALSHRGKALARMRGLICRWRGAKVEGRDRNN
ncbi:MAG: RdgB/HAM1 family non-canonical purine NTP pyrophosphatase [Tepidisphaeraceae bacterium]|jgi:XTP/dITP diphosphohydrolase